MSFELYRHHHGLRSAPFDPAPAGPIHLGLRHSDALAHLRFGLDTNGGIVLFTGEIGTGKTTLCDHLLAELPSDVSTAFVRDPPSSAAALLGSACSSFGIADAPGQLTTGQHVDRLNRFLLDQHALGRTCLLVVDDAHLIAPDVLEQLRLLTNLETHERKLLQIYLVGRPELQQVLRRSELRQLAQRIVVRHHLQPLGARDVEVYVQRRLANAGGPAQLLPSKLMPRLHTVSGGVPRTINLICDRALLEASVQGRHGVDEGTLEAAAREVVGTVARSASWRAAWPAALSAGTVLTTAAAAAVAVAAASLQQWPAHAPGTLAGIAAEASGAEFAAPAGYDRSVATLAALPGSAATRPAEPWPTATAADGGEARAFATLYRQWGASFDDKLPPCDQGENPSLWCFEGHGGLDELRLLDLPAVVRVSDARGREMLLTLLSITADRAVLQVDGARRTVPLALLLQHWSGRHIVLWRGPADPHDVLYRGSRGAGVAWLQSHLAQLDGRRLAVVRLATYDGELEQRVRHFQKAEGLAVDGVAGINTMVRLSMRTDVQAPHLAVDTTH